MVGSLDPRQAAPAKTQLEHSDADSEIGLLPWEEPGGSKPATPLLRPHISRSSSASPISGYGTPSPLGSTAVSPAPHAHPARRTATVRESLCRFWARNRGVVLVAAAQLFGSLMNLSARLLELESDMHPLQILFARMSITTVCSCLYMWWKKVPDFPLGAKGIRGVLVMRGVSGFFGIYGVWYSMLYIPLAEATVITFLAPMLTGYICHVLLKDPFTRREQLASVIALAGVVLIARPTSLFGSGSDNAAPTTQPHTDAPAHQPGEPTPAQRLVAILVGLVGVVGAAGAFTAIRCIGKRAHPLITVNYFSVWSTLVSGAALLLAPALGVGQAPPHAINFAGLLPASPREWLLLGSLGLCGFVMQFMMTAGMGGDKSNRATAMVYTHMLFAAGFDRWVFGHRMGIVSLLGCGLIVGSALWAALGKKDGKGGGLKDAVGGEGDVERGAREEGVSMLGDRGDDGEESGVLRLR